MLHYKKLSEYKSCKIICFVSHRARMKLNLKRFPLIWLRREDLISWEHSSMESTLLNDIHQFWQIIWILLCGRSPLGLSYRLDLHWRMPLLFSLLLALSFLLAAFGSFHSFYRLKGTHLHRLNLFFQGQESQKPL